MITDPKRNHKKDQANRVCVHNQFIGNIHT
jgi:hypothetical protein